MVRLESWFAWVTAWSLCAACLTLSSWIGFPVAVFLVIVLVGLAGAREAGPEALGRGFIAWGTAAALGAAAVSLAPSAIFLAAGLVGGFGEILAPSRHRHWRGRMFRALSSSLSFVGGTYLTYGLGLFLHAPIEAWLARTLFAEYGWVIAFGLGGLGGGLFSEGVRRTPRLASRLTGIGGNAEGRLDRPA